MTPLGHSHLGLTPTAPLLTARDCVLRARFDHLGGWLCESISLDLSPLTPSHPHPSWAVGDPFPPSIKRGFWEEIEISWAMRLLDRVKHSSSTRRRRRRRRLALGRASRPMYHFGQCSLPFLSWLMGGGGWSCGGMEFVPLLSR
eukprot:scaffold134805_cov28-Tisochrysis_lutea.AAC.1